MRKKKTPEELAAEAEQEDLDDFTSKANRFNDTWCKLNHKVFHSAKVIHLFHATAPLCVYFCFVAFLHRIQFILNLSSSAGLICFRRSFEFGSVLSFRDKKGRSFSINCYSPLFAQHKYVLPWIFYEPFDCHSMSIR